MGTSSSKPSIDDDSSASSHEDELGRRSSRKRNAPDYFAPPSTFTYVEEDMYKEEKRMDQRWEAKFKDLVRYKEAHDGGVTVPASENPTLSKWIENQKAFHKKDKLLEERAGRLKEIGVSFETKPKQVTPKKKQQATKQYRTNSSPSRFPAYDQKWELNFNDLVRYKKYHGNVFVVPSKNPILSKWIENQKTFHKRDKLSEERAERLKEIGISFEQITPTKVLKPWDKHFQDLVNYKSSHDGDVNVQTWENQSLAKWLENQRGFYRRKALTEERAERLKNIGVCFERKKTRRTAPS